jgi:type VII secretion integral membrane protein EccD
MLLCTVLGAVAVADRVPAFVGAGLACMALSVTTLVVLLSGVPAAAAAAVLATVGVAGVPGLPMLAYRLARLPVPAIPATTDEPTGESAQVPGADVLCRTILAAEYLTALLAALSVVVLGCLPVLLTSDRWTAWLLVLVTALALLTRARSFAVVTQKVPLLLAGLLGSAVLLVGVALGGPVLGPALPAWVRVGGAVLLPLAAGGAAAGHALTSAGRRSTPVPGRVLDVLEVVLGLAVVPLALDVCGLYSLIRAWGG